MAETKTERQELELKVHHALSKLSDYFRKSDDPLQYEVNRLWRQLDGITSTPASTKAK